MAEAAQKVDQAAEGEQKLRVDKYADGSILCLKFSGTIDEDFDGKKLAASTKAKTLLLDLGDIGKISSFGIREWVDFVNAISKNAEQVILLQCSPKVVDQLNMVANFAGPKGKVYSFYCPYTCDYCDTSPKVMMQVDRDHEVIKSMKPPERVCEQCGEPEYFDEDPATYFAFMAGQAPFELEYEVEAFLATKLDYAVSDGARKLRIDKAVEGRSIYVKLAGDLDGAFPKEKLAEGLEGTIVLDVSGVGRIDPAGAAEWRGAIQMMTPNAEAIFLEGVPPSFLEKLTGPEDLGAKAKVLSFTLPYQNEKDGMTQTELIDVEEHYEVIKFATPPEIKGSVCIADENMLSFLPKLPPIEVPKEVRKFIKEMKSRKPEKKGKATTVAEAAAQGRGAGLGTMLAGGFIAAALAVGGMFGYNFYQKSQEKEAFAKAVEVGEKINASAQTRPAWLTSDTQFSSYCAKSDSGLSCVGVSSYSETQEDARVEAQEAALEALVNEVGLQIEDENWGATVRELYAATRQAKMERFDRASGDEDAERYDSAKREVRAGRTSVVESFKKTGGASVPTQPTSEYWEEFNSYGGKESRFQVFVQYQLPPDAVERLVGLYSKTVEARGATAVTYFPAVGWRYPEIAEGAVITDLKQGDLASFGLAKKYVVTSIQDRVVKDAAGFQRIADEVMTQLKDDGGNLKLMVKTGDTTMVEFNKPVAGKIKEPVHQVRPSTGATRPTTGSGINHWRQGGGNRENPWD